MRGQWRESRERELMRPGERIMSGDYCRRLKLRFGLDDHDPRIVRAMGYQTFKARMGNLKTIWVTELEREDRT